MPLFAIYLFIISIVNGIFFVWFQSFCNISLFCNSQSHQDHANPEKEFTSAHKCVFFSFSFKIWDSENKSFQQMQNCFRCTHIQSNIPFISSNHEVVTGSRWILFSWPFCILLFHIVQFLRFAVLIWKRYLRNAIRI